MASQDRRYTLQRLANEQAYARKRLKELGSELGLVHETIAMRGAEVAEARAALGPNKQAQMYAQRIEAISAEV